MSNKICVPEGMINAAAEALQNMDDCIPVILEAALRWLSENPIVPTHDQWGECGNEVSARYRRNVGPSFSYGHEEICAEWQRRMFFEPELEPSFEERMNSLTVEVNRLGMNKAIEILRGQK